MLEIERKIYTSKKESGFEDNMKYNDPEAYDKRYLLNKTEKYLHERWHPFLFSKVEQFCKGTVTVDLGCGSGGFTSHMTDAKSVIAVDISLPMIEYCANKFREFTNIDLLLCDVVKCPIKLEVADFVFVGLLPYIDPEVLFTECNKILKNKGIIMMTFFNKWNFLHFTTRLIRKLRGKKTLSRSDFYKDIFKKLEDQGFVIKEIKSFGMITYCPLFLQKYVKYLWILMDKIYAPFQKMFPLGSSIMVIAQKSNKSEEIE